MAFHLYIIDKENNKFDLLGSLSQEKMDSFTTMFENEKDLLNDLELDSKDFRVLVEKKYNNKVEPVLFLGKKYNVLNNITNYETFVKLVASLTQNDNNKKLKQVLELYVNEELLNCTEEEENINTFYRNRVNELMNLDNVLSYDKYYSNLNYFVSIKKCISDGKDVKYNLARRFIKTAVDLGMLNSIDLKKDENLIKEKKQEVKNSLGLDTLTFVKGKLSKFEPKKVENDSLLDEEVNYMSNIIDLDDDLINELDIMMESNKMDLEQRNKYIENHKEKIFKY